MVTHISKTPDQTCKLGEILGRTLRKGDVVGLIGDLGFGKTQFVKGIALGLGIQGRIHSPTFTLVNEYGPEENKLFHLDLYRLENEDQILSAGLEQYVFNVEGVTVIEWFERWGSALPTPEHGWIIRFDAISEFERVLSYEAIGA